MKTNILEQQYLNLLQEVLKNGNFKHERTGVGTISVFGQQMKFNLSNSFPLLTTKKVFLKAIIHELLWFLQGQTNIKYLVDNNINIWNEWPYRHYQDTLKLNGEIPLSQQDFIKKIKEDQAFAQKWGELGPVYGKQWRDWKTKDGKVIDQITQIIHQIKHVKKNKHSSYGRRLIVSAWNAADIEEMSKRGLPPCHTLFQFYVLNDTLSCQLYQRAGDLFLGVPFNIASYSLLLLMMAQVCDLKPGDFVHTLGDAHIYSNHVDQVKEQLKRTPRPFPKMKLNPKVTDIFNFTFDDFTLEGYDPYPSIKASVAI